MPERVANVVKPPGRQPAGLFQPVRAAAVAKPAMHKRLLDMGPRRLDQLHRRNVRPGKQAPDQRGSFLGQKACIRTGRQGRGTVEIRRIPGTAQRRQQRRIAPG